MNKAKILCFDIETIPCVGTFWRPGYNVYLTHDNIAERSQMAMWSAKYTNSNKMYSMNMHDDGYDGMIQGLWDILDEADILVAHNGDKFDRRWCNTEFLLSDLPDPSKWVDTYKIAKANFELPSYKLDYLSFILGFGRKINTDYDLWLQWMEGDPKAIKKMIQYCKNDVKLLQKVYKKMLPWASTHPNIAVRSGPSATPLCGKCGSDHIIKKGLSYTNVGIYQRYRCRSCGSSLKGHKTQLPKEMVGNITRSEAMK